MSIHNRTEEKQKLKQFVPVADAQVKHHVFVCSGKACTKLGSPEVKAEFEKELETRRLRQEKEAKGRNPNGEFVLTDCGSVSFCSIGTAVLVNPEGV